MRTTVLPPDLLGPADVAAWRTLQQADPALASPFLSPEFARAVGRRRPEARVAVLSDGAGPVGYFPYERHPFGLGLPIGTGLCDAQGLVHAAGVHWDPRELLRACGLQVWRYDHLVRGQTPFDGGAVRRAASPVVDLTRGPDTYRAELRRRSAERFRQWKVKERRLAHRLGEVRLVYDDPTPAHLDTLMRWKSAQYRATGQLDLFARPSVAALLWDLGHVRSPTCTGTLSTLYAGERPVALHFGLRSRSVLQYWFPAYAPEAARFSPGILLLLKLAQAAADDGVDLLDLGKGGERYKQELKTGDLTLTEGWVARDTLPAALLRTRAESVRRVRTAVSAHPGMRKAASRLLNARWTRRLAAPA
ncbi:GNAT family N-acetyltransferase [Streptomyces sp. NPDC014776]|uniref:GNAT family N-acetyltransferase n=1 Tax=unclassified Streptomyces TaxID=2593676 RepID=UPI0037022667